MLLSRSTNCDAICYAPPFGVMRRQEAVHRGRDLSCRVDILGGEGSV